VAPDDPVPVAGTVWRPGRSVELAATLGPLLRGAADPAMRWADGALWRSGWTPAGPGTLRLRAGRDGVEAAAWGPGGGWLVDSVPDLLGVRDDPSGFRPRHPLLREVARRHPGLRIPRSRLVLDSLVPAVLEQKVTSVEARRSWCELLRRHGEPAPGPAPRGLRVPLPPWGWRDLPGWEWHRAGVDGARVRTVRAAATVARRLEDACELPVDVARRRLRAVPGVGPWTAAEVATRALGDADAVAVGDLHLPRLVGWALAGRPTDDAGMLELLEEYRPHRARVIRLVELSGVRAPRFGPRAAPRDMRSM